jgi:isoleucyl-tRNA synthetase
VDRLPEDVTRVEFDRGAVHVDGDLPAELRRRGLFRDVVRRARAMRADLDLDVEERVRLWIDADDGRPLQAVEAHGAELRREWTVDGMWLWLGVEPVDA